MRRLQVLSLGAGTQSTALLLLSLEGELPPLDGVYFADTQWEPAAVYAHLDRLAEYAHDRGVNITRLQTKSIRDVAKFGTGSALDMPFYVIGKDGRTGMVRHQCSAQLKARPIRTAIRELCREHFDAKTRRRPSVDHWFGISYDEVHRMRDSGVAYITNTYPLVDMRWTRQDCIAYLKERGWDVPRSACIGCPFRGESYWRELKRARPGEFAQAVDLEERVQRVGLHSGQTPYLHRSCRPLDEVDLDGPEAHGQLVLDECGGACFT